MWHITCDTWHIGYNEYMWKLQVSSSYSLGEAVKWHMTPAMWHETHARWFKRASYIPDRYETIWFLSMCSVLTKRTSFLLKLDLHCNLPHFRNISNISGEQAGKTTELIWKCQFKNRQWNIIPFERWIFCKGACCAGCRADPSRCNSTSRKNPPIQL